MAGLELAPDPAEPDVLIYMDGEQPPLQQGSKATVVLGRMRETESDDQDLARAARAANAIFLPLQTGFNPAMRSR